jgi:DNA ligase-1
MPDLADGESTEMQGSSATPYVLKNTGGVYSCTCPAWRNQGAGIERRTCKHLKKLRGEAAELERVGSANIGTSPRPKQVNAAGEEVEAKAPPLLLAHSWESDVDLVGWWMSEKLDGVRAYWDGKGFLSRLGNRYHAPDWFVEGLPDTPLDGEIWGGRKKFQQTVSVARRQDKSEHWRTLKYVVFDAPALDAEFESRIDHVKSVLTGKAPFAEALGHELCEGVEHLKRELSRVEGLGGEGLMLRKPRSKYEVGRSSTLLKVKTFHDAEARVVQHLPGEGKHKGKLGALLVELANGIRFSVGTGLSDAERRDPPRVGDLITFRYQELSDGGVPRFPSYVGIRHDAAGPSIPVAVKPAAAEIVETPKEPQKPETPKAPKEPKAEKPVATAAVATAAVATPAVASDGVASKRYFELVEGNSSKFWEITVSGVEHRVRFGRIGTSGQTKLKSFATEAAARTDAESLVREKTKKGYTEADAQKPCASTEPGKVQG